MFPAAPGIRKPIFIFSISFIVLVELQHNVNHLVLPEWTKEKNIILVIKHLYDFSGT